MRNPHAIMASLRNCVALGAVAISSYAMPAIAQDAPQEETTDDADTGDTIVVEGFRFIGKQDVEAKEFAAGIYDSISADEVGAVPDFNIVDAFRRVPGVSAEFDEDEGRFINIRGIDSNLNYVTINGLGVPSTGNFGDGGRNVDIEFFPSTAVKRLEVYKTITPDMDGSSIGGYANIVTRSAFDAPGTFLVARGTISQYNYTEIPTSNKLPVRLEGTFSDRFGSDGQFGFLVTGLYTVRPRDQQKEFLVNGYTSFPNITPPDRYNVSLYGNNQYRYGGNAALEYRAGDTEAALTGYWYKQRETETRYVNNLQIAEADVTETSPTTGLISRAQNEIAADYFPIQMVGKGLQFNVDQQLGERAKLSVRSGWGKQTFNHDTPAINFRSGKSPALGFELDMSNPIYTRSEVNDPAYLANPANYAATLVRYRELNTQENVYDNKIDLGWNNDKDNEGFGFKIGAEYRRLERKRDNEQFDLASADRAALRLADFLSDATYVPRYQPGNFHFIDSDKLRDYIASANLPRNDSASTSGDFNYKEDIVGTYGMALYRSGPFYLAGGVRYENTEFEAGAVNQPKAVRGNYENWLPSVLATYEITGGLKVRGGFSKTLGRPNPSDLAVTTVVNEAADDASVDVIVTRGNPDLQPRKSNNYDLSLEYYFNNGEGMFSAAVFQKNISGDIFQLRTLGTYDGQSAEFRQNVNALNSRVKGLELAAYLGTMPFLPEPFDGFGVSANATFLDGKMVIPTGQANDLSITTATIDRRVRQPNFIANASLFYEYEGFEARIAYNYSDKFLLDLTRMESSYDQFDASMGYKINDHFRISVQARNVLGADRKQFDDTDDFNFLFGVTDIAPSYHFTLSYNL